MSHARGRWLGYVQAVAAACLWGSSGIFAVHLFRMGVTPVSLALLRPAVGAVFLLAVVGIWRPRALRVDLGALAILALGGGAAVGVFQVAYQMSTDAVGVPTTVALLYIAPAIVTAASGPLLGEWPTRQRVVFVALTLTGVWLSVAGAAEIAPTFGTGGLAWGLLAGFSYALYTLFGRFATPRYGAIPTVVYSTVGSCVVLVAAVPFLGEMALPRGASAWWILVAFGVLTIATAQFLFFDALGRIEASRASIATAAEPVVASLLATFLLGQGLRPVGWLGIALVVAGVAGVGVMALKEDRSESAKSA